MTNISNPIVFFGTEDFSLIALKALVDENYPVVAVVTKPDSAKGRGQQIISPAVKTFAADNNISVWQPVKLKDITEDILKLDKPIGVLVSYGKIIPQSTLDLFTPGIINVHPSLLPKYRGPSPIESAILNGDQETGVSIMQLSASMDAGPIYGYAPLALLGTETSTKLYESLGRIGSETLLELLPLICSGEVSGQPQNDEYASYCQLIKKVDGNIDWNKSATQIEREVRAYNGWPQSHTKLGDIDIIITSSRVVWHNNNLAPGELKILYSDNAKALLVGTGDGDIEINSVKPPGKKEMSTAAFLSGYRSLLNI